MPESYHKESFSGIGETIVVHPPHRFAEETEERIRREERTRCALVARSFDALPFAMQQSGGLALAIADAINDGTSSAVDWAASVKWPPGVKEHS